MDRWAGRNLVFIVGGGRSGTTWLQRLLATHPSVHTGQESKLFRSYISPQLAAWRWELLREADPSTATGRGGTGLSCYFTEDEFVAVLRRYTRRLLRQMMHRVGPGEWFLEKTPGHAFCLRDIQLMLPQAKVIHVLRDGRDVVASMLAAARGWGMGWAPRSASAAATSWVRSVRAAREGAGFFPASQFLEIRYEDLVADPTRLLATVATFLDLPWSSTDIAAAVLTNEVSELRSGRGTPLELGGRFADQRIVKEPSDFVRRGTAGGWQQDLSRLEKLVTWRIAGPLLTELGYAQPFFDKIRVAWRGGDPHRVPR